MDTLSLYADRYRELDTQRSATVRVRGAYSVGQRLLVAEVSQTTFRDTHRYMEAVVSAVSPGETGKMITLQPAQ